MAISRTTYRRTQKSMLDAVNFYTLGNLLFYPNDPNVVMPSQRFFYFKNLLTDYRKNGSEEYRIKANQIGKAAVSALTDSPFGSNEQEKNSRSIQRLRDALNIIEKGIEYEQANEKQYIQQRLNKLKSITKLSNSKTEDLREIEQNLQILNNQKQGIDYKVLIDTINIAMQGKKNSQAIYDYEYNRLTNEVMPNFLKARDEFADQIKRYANSRHMDEEEEAKQFEKSFNKFDRIATQTYLRNHTYNIERPKGIIQRILKSAMKGTKTIDVVMGEKITEFLNKIFSDPQRQEEMLNIIVKNKLTVNGFSNSAREIKPKIIALIVQYLNNNVSEILNNNLDVEGIVNDFANEIERNGTQEYQIQIKGLYKNFAQYGHQLDFFKEGIDAILEKEQGARGLYDALVNFRKQVNKEIKENKVAGLDEETKYVRKALGLQSNKGKYNQLITLIKSLEKFSREIKKAKDPTKIPDLVLTGVNEQSITLSVKEKNGVISVEGLEGLINTNAMAELNIKKNFNPKTLSSAISSIKRRVSEDLRDALTDIIRKEQNTSMREQIVSQLESKLQNIKISVGGPVESEIKGAIQQNLTDNTVWTGKLNVKNDVISINIDIPNFLNFKFENGINTMSSKIEEKVSTLMQNTAKRYGEEYTNIIQQNMSHINKDRAYTDYERLTKEFFAATKKWRDSYTKITEEFNEARKEIENLIQKEGHNKKELQTLLSQQEDFLEDLQNTIYVSSTMKTFNAYQNHIGFVGGSIGSSASAQISNLNFLFSQAGMGLSQEELDWLTFAVINNSPESVVGLKNESFIESMLGSLAVFAMFDEGGAELQILRDKVKGLTEEMITPKIMHLYLLNGIYYPGSYVLETIRQTLIDMLDILDIENAERNFSQSGIRITNTINIGDLPNLKSRDRGDKTLDRKAWQTMSNTADNKKVTVHVTFLAGLMDVIQQLRAKEGQIVIPS